MQNDTGRAFSEIYDSTESFLAAIEEIEQVALIQRFDDAPLRVRLLTPYESKDSSTFDYAITTLDTFRGDEIYVTVSYAWAHSQSTTGLQIPSYRIWDLSQPSEPPRPPRCPSVIFHRAAQYARTKGYAYLWIDQEYIYQRDEADRERHLQVMHRIYSASAVTIAALSVHMPDALVLEEFIGWALNEREPRETTRTLPTGTLADWLLAMTSDAWFTRTWTMQEKLCSHHLEYLIPLSQDSSIPINTSRYNDLVVGTDLAISVQQAVANTDMRASPAPGLLNLYQKLGKWLQPSVRTTDDLVRNIEFALCEMGPRENSVTSDRLAILANVCDLAYTLHTTALNAPAFSYRTSLLVLTFANAWPLGAERKGKYRRFAAHEMRAGEGGLGKASPVDVVLEEFIKRPRIGEDMRWIHYDLDAGQRRD